MAERQSQGFCKSCQRQTLHAKQELGFGWGCLLTILTGGLFLLIWLPLMLIDDLKRPRCQFCGTKN